jgi:hypothetical protein
VIGYTDVCEVDFSFAMQLTRVHEDPRVTKPYSDAQGPPFAISAGRWTRTSRSTMFA